MNRRHFLAASTATTALAATRSYSEVPSKDLKVIIPPTKPDELADLKAVAPSVRLVECENEEQAIAQIVDADASYAFISQAIIRAGKSLRWLQQPSAGVEHLIEIPELLESDIVLTNMQRALRPRDRRSSDRLPPLFHSQPHTLRAHSVKRGMAFERTRGGPRRALGQDAPGHWLGRYRQ